MRRRLAIGSAILLCVLGMTMLLAAEADIGNSRRSVVAPDTPLAAHDRIPVETLPPTRATPAETATVPTTTATITSTLPVSPTLTSTPSPTSSPTLTATPTPTPRPVSVPLAMRDQRHIQNGGFETGALRPEWFIQGNLPCGVTSLQKNSGHYSAILGNPDYDWQGHCPVGRAGVWQYVDVPTGGHPAIYFSYRIYSNDTVEFDYFGAEVTDVYYGTTSQVWRDGATQWTGGNFWVSSWRDGVIPLDAYAGRTIKVCFFNELTNHDGWYNTWSYLDDVELVTDAEADE